MIKIVLTGPESSGKTTLAQQLSATLGCPLVPEFARDFLTALNRPYTEADLLDIARGQLELEDRMAGSANLLVCDTDLITIRIWSVYKYGRCHDWIEQQITERKYAAYLLCKPDMPWEIDPLRESPDSRDELYKLYKQELLQREKKFLEMAGNEEDRLQAALRFVRPLLKI